MTQPPTQSLTFRTVCELSRDIACAAPGLVKGVDAVVGVPRSGVLAASLLALHAQTPLGTVDEVCNGAGLTGNVRRILLLDDTVHGGGTIQRAVARIVGARPEINITRACVYRAPGTSDAAVDRHVAALPMPRCFEWNIWRSVYLPQIAFDLDGVLCDDPDFVDHGDERYETFIRDVSPRFLPSRPVSAIVTCRLERWRELTEDWLRRHGVRYNRLHMMDYPTAQARRAAGNHAGWKAEIYGTSNDLLFVESSTRQATAIAQRTGRLVWCTDDRRLYGRDA